MKASLPILLICALVYVPASMADCGDEDASNSMDESVAPAPSFSAATQIAVPQVREDRNLSPGTGVSLTPARHKLEYTPYEDEGYKP